MDINKGDKVTLATNDNNHGHVGIVMDVTATGALVQVRGTNTYVPFAQLKQAPSYPVIELRMPSLVASAGVWCRVIKWTTNKRPEVGMVLEVFPGGILFEITSIEFTDEWRIILRGKQHVPVKVEVLPS